MNEEIAALIELHRGLERLGPGSREFSLQILASLPTLREAPRIADLGCGAGAATLLLAEWFNVPVKAVDLSGVFLQHLDARAAELGLTPMIQTFHADMGALNWPEQSLDLLWSEGAAYNLTFPGALNAWRPLLTPGGLAVVSELSWFSDNPPEEARDFWAAAYPTLAGEQANTRHAREANFEVLATRRLPTACWWEFYYGPLLERVEALRAQADPVMSQVIHDTEVEIDLFRRYAAEYGYTFYILRAR
ncbi:MAG: class I SAM-dependent methyltransferase [Candidatus Hydrogenedentes bacterium]|nr:class I SAM-dependent methyltransferase [Candidatus Hydrogenedentota bacterium]